MRYEKPTVPTVRRELKEAWSHITPNANITVRRVGETLWIELPRGMRTYSTRRFLRSNVLIPVFGKRASAAIRFERHSWWEN